MKRRDFIKGVAAAGLAARWRPSLFAGQAPPPAPDLAMVEGASPYAITKEVVAALGGMSRFVGKGDRVVVKPNIGWDRTPEMAANTNPEVVKALVELAQDAGARRVIVIDNTTNQARRCYIRSGIQDAVRQAGGTMLFVDEHRIRRMDINGMWLKEWDIILDIFEADKIINVPIAKHHSLCHLTLGMKNWLGAIGGARNQLHQRIDEAMVDLAAFFKPALTVLDAYRILVRNGPQGGRISDTEIRETIVAGVDVAAIDTIGASFFGLGPKDLLFLRLAHERGLGRIDLEGLPIEKRKI